MSENQTKTAPKPEVYGAKKPYEEWMVEVKKDEKGKRKADKIKFVRKDVMLTEESAAILNSGVLNMPLDDYGNNRLPSMYFAQK